VHDLAVEINVGGEDVVLDLKLNRYAKQTKKVTLFPSDQIYISLVDRKHFKSLHFCRELIPKSFFVRHQGASQVFRPTAEQIDLCEYKGTIRGKPDSWAAVSTCNGLRFVVFFCCDDWSRLMGVCFVVVFQRDYF
jgi:Reprolysin family propeptide